MLSWIIDTYNKVSYNKYSYVVTEAVSGPDFILIMDTSEKFARTQ